MATVTVSVLFTDLVGSTALMSRVGEVAAEELRREHFSLLRAAVDSHSGTEVKNLGDGLMAVFTSTADAVSAAVDAQRSLQRRNRRAAEPLEVRMGIAAGDADVDDGDYFGVPVVAAARLCAAAAGGEVLCTDLVRLLAGSRAEASYESIGDLELKGLDQPVPACRVTWAADGDDGDGATAPLPVRLSIAQEPNFVGREHERRVLAQAWKGAEVDGRRQVVLLAGEPGIGKTTLAARLAAEVHDQGGLVVYGRSDEDLGIPHQPWVEALGSLVEAVDPSVLADHVEACGGHLGRLVPALVRRTGVAVPEVVDADGERYVLYRCATDLLERASAEVPVLVVLDDLHWADPQSLQLLRHLITSDRPLRLLVVGTFRDSDVTVGSPLADLLAALHREAGVERLALAGLSDADLLDLLEQLAGHDLDEAGLALRDAVLAETAGNPFFVGEILRHLVESGAIYRNDEGQWVGDADVRSVGLPVSVREVVGRRIARLGPEAERLLTAGSVIGRDFEVSVAAAVAGVEEDRAIDLCDEAVTALVLRETQYPDRYTFAHALIEHTLYLSLSAARRARTHRAVAEALEDRLGTETAERVGELAYHWAAAVQPADAGRAVRYAQLAGERALAQSAPHDAVRWFAQALELLGAGEGDSRGRAELMIGLGIARRLAGEPGYRETLLEAGRLAHGVGDTSLIVRAALENNRGWNSRAGATDAERVAALEAALASPGVDDDDRALLLVVLAMERTYELRVDERRRVVDEAVALARGVGDPAKLAATLHLGAVAIASPRTVEQRRGMLEEAAEVVQQLGDPGRLWGIRDQQFIASLESGDFAGARHFAQQAAEAADAAPEPARLWVVQFQRFHLLVVAGDLEAAERQSELALAAGLEAGEPDAFTVYVAQLAAVRHFQGRLHDLVSTMEEALETTPGLDVYRSVIAAGLAQGRELARSCDLLDQELRAGFPEPAHEMELLVTWSSWVMAAWFTAHREAGEILVERLEEFRARWVYTGSAVTGSMALILGLAAHAAGRLDEAVEFLTEAHQLHDGAEAPLFSAMDEAVLAGVLFDRGHPADVERAHRLVGRCTEAAAAGGYGLVDRLVETVLDQRRNDGA